jgi:predicted aspartyl protease
MDSPMMKTLLEQDPNFVSDIFWSDGMVRSTGREYNGLIDSPCYRNATEDARTLSCSSCHSMHKTPDDPRSESARDAHNVLTQIYIRTGQYARMRREIAAWTAAQGESAPLREATKDAELFRDLPDQITGPRRPARLQHGPGEITLPVSINGKRADYLFDTGAWISLITRGEVARLGLSVQDGDRPLSDGVMVAAVRTVVVPELRVGDTRFRNVSFAVVDAPEEFGILGVPVLLGLGRIDWSQVSTVEIGGVPSAAERRTPNLVFDGNHVLLRLKVFDKDVLTLFDTGAETTDLTANFAAAFPNVKVSRGDVSNYLTGAPLDAKRDSALYLLSKALRRNKLPVAIAAAFIALILGSTIALSFLYSRQSQLLADVRQSITDVAMTPVRPAP